MTNKNLEEIAIKYYELVVKKETSQIEKLLHPEVEFIGPMSTLQGKEKVFIK